MRRADNDSSDLRADIRRSVSGGRLGGRFRLRLVALLTLVAALSGVVDIRHFCDHHRQRAIEAFLLQPGEQFAILDFPLSDANLELVLTGVTEMDMMNVF